MTNKKLCNEFEKIRGREWKAPLPSPSGKKGGKKIPPKVIRTLHVQPGQFESAFSSKPPGKKKKEEKKVTSLLPEEPWPTPQGKDGNVNLLVLLLLFFFVVP
jgi:hypothetical protein